MNNFGYTQKMREIELLVIFLFYFLLFSSYIKEYSYANAGIFQPKNIS